MIEWKQLLEQSENSSTHKMNSDKESKVSHETSENLNPVAEVELLFSPVAGLQDRIKKIPDKLAFKIGDVAEIVGVKQYVLRFWESEFEQLKPKKSKSGQRMYSRRDVEVLLLIKKLLHEDRFSIEGAKTAINRLKKQVKNQSETFIDELKAIDSAGDLKLGIKKVTLEQETTSMSHEQVCKLRDSIKDKFNYLLDEIQSSRRKLLP